MVISQKLGGRLTLGQRREGGVDAGRRGRHRLGADLVLNHKNVRRFGIEPLRPSHTAVAVVDELRRHSQLVTGSAQTASEGKVWTQLRRPTARRAVQGQ